MKHEIAAGTLSLLDAGLYPSTVVDLQASGICSTGELDMALARRKLIPAVDLPGQTRAQVEAY